MFRKFARLALIAATTTLCAHAQDTRPTTSPTSQPSSRPAKSVVAKKWLDELAKPIKIGRNGNWAEYGGSVTMLSQTSLKAVANNPTNFKDKTILLRGTIDSICVKKGCWIRMKDNGEEIFVKFKDYAFFAPRHLSGHEVTLEGQVTYSVVKEAERRHMAEDAGKTPEEIARIKGDENELRMMARSMRIIEPKKDQSFKVTLMIGDFDKSNKAHPVDAVLKSKATLVDEVIDVSGQVVSITRTGFIVESSGRRLVLQFTNDKTVAEKLLMQLKASPKTIMAQGHGRLLETEKGLYLAMNSVAITY
ncbi:MAG: hypothetical protein ACI97A_003041 [Planctomycetota bacterium]|jgi:hypothetical protein